MLCTYVCMYTVGTFSAANLITCFAPWLQIAGTVRIHKNFFAGHVKLSSIHLIIVSFKNFNDNVNTVTAGKLLSFEACILTSVEIP